MRSDARGLGQREIGAGLCVAIAVLAATLGGATDRFGTRSPAPDRVAASGLPLCPEPRESEASDGQTRRVRCDGEGGVLRGPARILYGLGIDPNHADAATLEVLPGIGPARAAAVVAGRADAPYTEARDLLRVRGIGPVTLRRAADWLAFPGSQGGVRSSAGGPP